MSNSNLEIRLAESPQGHKDLTRRVEDLCDKLMHHGEAQCADWLFELIELIGDVRTDAHDREGLFGDVMNRIFPHTTAGNEALEAATLAINPKLAGWAARVRKAAA